MMLGVRTVHSSCIIRSSANSSHSLSSFFCSFHQYRPTHSRTPSKLGFLPSKCRFELHFNGYGGKLGVSDGHSLVDSVLKELHERRRTMRVQFSNKCFPCRLESTSNGELLKDKLEKQELRGGLLLEFKKDTERVLLAVVQKPDGKKNWMVSDQNGTTCSIKPQQITYVVPGVENFEHTQIPEFIQKAQDNLDASLLELAWAELLEKNNSVTPKELAEIIYGTSEPLESYCAHLLLSKDEIYFSMMETKGYCSVYAPRPIDQVEELLRRRLAKETAEKELQEFIQLLSSAKARPMDAKLSRSSWILEERIRDCVEALAAYAVDTCCTEIQKRTVGTILTAMGLAKSSSSAFNLLIDIGYFPVHVNLDLLKLNIRTNHSDDIVSAAEDLLSVSFDIDEIRRIDLTHLKVYAIDVDEADELDDALSAARLQDGRIKIWIHVADATCLVQPGSTLDKEAMSRGTSVFLPTATYPMFPEKLAMEGMSLKQGKKCNAVTVSVVLHPDGSIAEYSVENTFIRPTYMLTYESASELLHLSLEEEAELKILSEAAALRLHWRRQQGAVDTSMIETRVKVENPDDPEPRINLYVENQADPAMRLVSEMMILCGEVIATFGSCNNINLPYRGQPQSNIDVSAFSHLPEGPARSCAIVKIMRAAEYDFRKPIRHGILGIPGYVQFTSPIRRYMDLLAHYQVKAFIRGDSPPFSAGQLEGIASIVNMQQRVARKLYNSSLRYWILEYLRRQPRERKFRALILRFIKDRIAALILVEVGLLLAFITLFSSQRYASLTVEVG
ncbi:ribonuclease II, chloroplastic/mitochondrial isoform X3 [Beta vulgaris subsp. vulgaris]|uniref:ribonuclease II, chloroplastic/mitochondrial isoform X3 n=1 Tax=Beta vulgaris subsp. vulgaris TaxID=3555 RepID=UPI0025480F1D|nr:ribonuclease II, chloroplastic/mitochondrial isoform X3 [Beta vulgaris subsp. vulgaris]